jgi:hypothetical protein
MIPGEGSRKPALFAECGIGSYGPWRLFVGVGDRAELFRVLTPVVLGKDRARLTGAIRDRTLADLTAGNGKARDCYREAPGS